MTRTLSALLLSVTLATAAAAQDAAVRAGAILDPETGTLRRDQTILVRGGVIEAVGADLAVPAGVEVIDLSDAVVMPGLIDAHTHLAIRLRPERDQGEYLLLEMYDPPGYRAIQGVVHAREMLQAGFTTVRDVGNSGDYLDLDLKRAIAAGLVPGPTVVAAGRIIAPFGGQHYLRDLRDDGPRERSPEYLIADTPDELVRAVRKNAYQGTDLIKIVVDPHRYAYSEADVRLVVEEAGRAGMKVAAHAQTAEGARRAARAGVASIEHGWSLPDDVLRLMAEKRIPLVSTDFTEEVLRGFGWDSAGAARIHARRVERLRQAYAAGVPLVFGSDIMVAVAGKTRGAAAAGYVASYLEAGVPAAVALRAFTTEAARLLGVEAKRGRIAPGLAADLVALPANPLDDLRALERVFWVMRDGRVIR